MRDIPVGNGTLLVNFDDRYQIRDVYFPHVGQENHTEGNPCRFGIWVDGEFSWVASDEWERELRYLPETLVTDVVLRCERLGIEMLCSDTVASHENVFLRSVEVRDLTGTERKARVFLHHDFRIYENKFGDTAYYDPQSLALIHYKKHRYLLVNTQPHFDSFATGRKAFQDKEGTWRDAEDGHLSGATITEGSVDSTIGVHLTIAPNESATFYYWIAAGTSYGDAAALNKFVLESRPEKFLEHTRSYWLAWVNKNDADLSGLTEGMADMYKRSLLIIRTQIDNDGAILAANDYDVTQRATDHYSYLWTRDGALVAHALDSAGYSYLARRFYDFCSKIVHPDGYFLQKYNADGTVASGWHSSWDTERREPVIPIQEDETALVLWALWHHYDRYRDIEFAHGVYDKLIASCGDFLVHFRDPKTGLPSPSWNLWEDRYGVHTFTCATVVAGLNAASNFAKLFADSVRMDLYRKVAAEVRDAMTKYLYSSELNRFVRSLIPNDSGYEADATIDASLLSVSWLECFPPDDPMVTSTVDAVRGTLSAGGGLARFENDGYMRTDPSTAGNAWFICTLWLADHLIRAAREPADLTEVKSILEWVVDHARPSGVMSEQIDPVTGEQVSVSPLTWSHSTFVSTICSYRDKMRALETLGH